MKALGVTYPKQLHTLFIDFPVTPLFKVAQSCVGATSSSSRPKLNEKTKRLSSRF